VTLGAILLLIGVPLANASVEIRIQNPGFGDTGWIVCADPSCSFNGVVGNFFLASDIAVKFDGINPFLDLSYVGNTLVPNAGTIIFSAMANGYLTNTPATLLRGSGNSTLNELMTITSWGGNNNALCPAGVNACNPAALGSNLLATIGPFMDLGGFNLAQGGAGNSVTPYSLGLVVTGAFPKNPGSMSGDIQLNAIPEPASVMLLGGLLVGVAITFRRKMNGV
jgi:hypothetical protein